MLKYIQKTMVYLNHYFFWSFRIFFKKEANFREPENAVSWMPPKATQSPQTPISKFPTSLLK